MRLLANPVVVCTSGSSTTADGETVPLGLTMSSFASLSLDPRPLVTFNLGTPSRTGSAIKASRRFAIHVLAGDAAGVRVAELFRVGNADPSRIAEGIRAAACEVVPGNGEGGEARPWLQGPGILYVLQCRLLDAPEGGLVRVEDHLLVMGEVLGISVGKGVTNGDKLGLAYADRQYRQLGPGHKADPDS
jgi:flavin reductase (DIM6/NTAB) family NADH-FMN oxidoreductase RutF